MEEKTEVQVLEPTNLSLSSNHDTEYLAKDLAHFIKEKQLSQNIKGNDYVNVEGWMYAGTRLGIIPIVEDVRNISTDSEVKYEARVYLIHIGTQNKMGVGYAICSNKEQGKKYFEEYAIASMAQTRAIGKAYRNILAWIIKAAGYSSTPAEEMDQVVQQENEIKDAIMAYISCNSREEVNAVWKKYPQYKAEPRFKQAAKAMSALYPAPPMSEEQRGEILELLNRPEHSEQVIKQVTGELDSYNSEQAAKTILGLKKEIATKAQEKGEKTNAKG